MAAAPPIKGNSGFHESPAYSTLRGSAGQKAKRARPDKFPPSTPYKTRSSTASADFRELCEDLGFQDDFPEDFLLLPEEVRGHQTKEEWILQLMQEKYDERLSESDSIASLTFESLEAVGFHSDKIPDILKRIPQRLRPYQETIYWAQQIVSDELFHLQNECPTYPAKIQDTPLNELTAWPAENPRETPIPRGLRYVKLDKFSRGSRSVGKHLENLVGFPRARRGEMMLYHATSHDSVDHILEHGIDLEAGKKPRDFSNGYSFYLDPDVDSCHDFASRTISAQAVLVYQVNVGRFTTNMLDLCPQDPESQDMDLWQEVVRCHRLPAGVPRAVGKLQQKFKLPRPYREYEVVFGPWCKNIDEVMRRKMPELPKPNVHQVQYMVQSQPLADVLHQSLKCVVYFPKK